MATSKAAVVDVDTGNAVKSLADLRKQINDLKADIYTLAEGTDEYKDKIQELGYAQDELSSFMQKTRQGCAALEGSYNALSYQMGLLKQAYHETADAAEQAALAEQINEINDKLKSMDEAVGNHSRNVGNYTKSMTEAFQNVGLTIGNISPLFNNLANGMMEAGKKGGSAFANLGTAAKGLGAQLKALAANPVGAVIMGIVLAVKAAKAIFDKFKESVGRNEEAQNNLSKAMAPFKAIVNSITNAFDGFVETLTKVAAGVGEVIGAFMKWTGLADDRVDAEEKLANMEIENAKLKRKYTEENAKLDYEASEARAKAAQKDKYTNKERIAFLQEYKDKQDQIAKNNLDMAKKELAALELEAAQGKNNAEMNDKIAQAKANVYRVQQAYNDKLRETSAQMAEINNQIKAEEEAKKKQAEELAKKYRDEINKLKDDYKSLLQTFNDALFGESIDYQISELHKKQQEEVKKLDEIYKKHAITKKQYDEAVLKSLEVLTAKEKKLYEEREKTLQDFLTNYKSIISNEITNALDAVTKKYSDLQTDLDKMLADGLIEYEDYEKKRDEIQKKYSEEKKNVRDENYIKQLDNMVALEEAAQQQIYDNKIVKNKQLYLAREQTSIEYLKNEMDLAVEYNTQMIAEQQAALDELTRLYENNYISEDVYIEKVQAIETSIIDLQNQTNEILTSQNEMLVDGYVGVYAQFADMMADYVSNISSIGEGISSAWSNVFSNISGGITEVADALKSGEKGWAKWGKVAASAVNAAASVMSAMADEQDTTTREGFERAKKYNIAAAVLSMLSGIAGAWASSMELMFPANVIIGAVLSTLMATVGGIQIAKIKQQTFDGGDSGSSAAASSNAAVSSAAMSSLNAPVQWSSNVEGASQTENVKDTRVYVVESDISDTATRVNIAESEAKY